MFIFSAFLPSESNHGIRAFSSSSEKKTYSVQVFFWMFYSLIFEPTLYYRFVGLLQAHFGCVLQLFPDCFYCCY